MANKQIHFSFLTLSLVAGAAFAQSNTAAEATAVPSELVSKPVVVNESLAPATVPVQSSEAVSSKLVKSEVEADKIISAPAADSKIITTDADAQSDAELGSVNSQNENGGNGTQIIINNNQDQDSKNGNENTNDNASASQSDSGADILRRERMRHELKNEGRLLEKIEEGRIDSELKRSETIEGIDFAGNRKMQGNATALETAQVAAVAVDGPAKIELAQVSNPSTVSVVESSLSSDSSSRRNYAKLTLNGGYRWMPQDYMTGYDIQNLGFFSGTFETQLATMLAVEGSIGFGRDRIETPYYYGGPYMMDPYYYARSRDVFEIAANTKLGYFKGTFQPFVLAGIGAIHQRYNIDNSYTLAEADYAGWSRTSTRMMGNLGAGVDFQLNRNVGFGVRYEWNYIFNKRYNPMNALYGDSENRMKIVGGLQISF